MEQYFFTYIAICIIARIVIAIIAKIIDVKYLPVMAIVTSFISIVFFKNFVVNAPKTGFFGNTVWWQNYRIIHFFNYGLFSLLAFTKNSNSWMVLLFDIFLGIIFFIKKYLI
tara:strand:- start:3578 stop:3913 length:336 start_codon:yes stop_codon:yes gene_type:complete